MQFRRVITLLLAVGSLGAWRTQAADPAGLVRVDRPRLQFSTAERWRVHSPGGSAVALACGPEGAQLSAEPVTQELHAALLSGAFELTDLNGVEHFRLAAELTAGQGLEFTIRLRDRDGEIGQLTRQELRPGMTALTWDVPADGRVGGTWGEHCNGVLDPPLRLHELFVLRRPGAPRAVARLQTLTGQARSRAVEALQVDLEAGNALRVVTPDDRRLPRLRLHNQAQQAVNLEADVTLSGLAGSPQTRHAPVALAANAVMTLELPLPETLGICWVDLTLRDPASDDRATLRRSFARMAPAGPTPGRAEGFRFSICTHTERWGARDQELEVLAAAQCGAKVIRTGCGWGSVEPQEGTWQWEHMDRIVAMYGAQGMELQCLLGFTPRWAAPKDRLDRADWRDWGFAAPRLDAWRRYVRAMALRYGDRIRYWEVWNEPDISFWRGTLDEYIELLQAAYAEIKAVDPKLQVMTGGFASYDRNPAFIEAVVDRAQASFDIFAHHRHGDFRGFQAEVDGPIAKLRARLVPPKPIYFNETAVASVGGRETMQAETLVKKLTFAWARGAMGYTWYDLRNDGFDPNEHEHTYGMVTHDFYPKAVYPTYNTLVRHLRDKQYVGELPVGDGRWAFAFAGGGETVVVAWSDRPQAAEELFLVAAAATAAYRLDIMDNCRPATVLAGGRVVLPLSGPPALLVLATEQACPALVGPLFTVVEVTAAVPGRDAHATVRLRNPSPSASDVLLAWRATDSPVSFGGEVSMTLAGDEERTVSLTVPVPALRRAAGNSTLPIAVTVSAGAGLAFAEARLTLPLAMLIPAGELERPADAVLSDRADVIGLFEADPNQRRRVWTGPADLSAALWLQRRADALHVRLAVTDDVHAQPGRGADQWQGDGVQMAFQVPGQRGFWEIGFAQRADGVPEAWCWQRPEGTADPVPAIALQVRRDGDRTLYDADLPFASFGLTRDGLASGLRLSLIVNDNDGHGRDGWIQLSEGIGRGKDTARFPQVLFE